MSDRCGKKVVDINIGACVCDHPAGHAGRCNDAPLVRLLAEEMDDE